MFDFVGAAKQPPLWTTMSTRLRRGGPVEEEDASALKLGPGQSHSVIDVVFDHRCLTPGRVQRRWVFAHLGSQVSTGE
jgi:hypothetical protein